MVRQFAPGEALASWPFAGDTLIRIGNFAPTKEDGDFGLILLPQKTLDMPDLDLQIVFIRLGTDLDFLHLNDRLLFLGFLRTLALLILELSVVHDLANGRVCIGSHFHQIQLFLCGQLQSLLHRQYAQLLPFSADYPNFQSSNSFVDIDLLLQDKILLSDRRSLAFL